MLRAAWIVLVLSLAGCGGSKSAATLNVECSGGTQLVGAASIDVQGDLVNGRPMMEFPDPANRGSTGTIGIAPHNHCTITPSGG